MSEVLKNYLRNKYTGERSEFYRRKIGVYHASATGKCLRQVYYRYTEEKPEKSSSWPHFLLGNDIERIYENALKEFYGYDYIKNSVRIELDYDDFVVVGQTDPVLFDDNAEPKKIFEVKSTSNIGPKKSKGPSKHHLYQVHPYIKALKCPCEIVYIQKNNLETTSFEVEFDPEIFNDGLSRIRKLHSYLENEEIPPPEPFQQWNCNYCEFKDLCDEEVEG